MNPCNTVFYNAEKSQWTNMKNDLYFLCLLFVITFLFNNLNLLI